MKNVLYPFSDLTKALIRLLNDLKTTDWEKATAIDSRKVKNVAFHLLKAHYHYIENFYSLNLSENFSASSEVNEIDNLVIRLKALIPENFHLVDTNTNDSGFKHLYASCWFQQQLIRQAIYNQELLQRHFYFPFLDYTLSALAEHFQNIKAWPNASVKVEVVGDAGGVWMIQKHKENWKFTLPKSDNTADALVYIDQQIAWLLFNGGVDLREAQQYYQLLGDRELGSFVLTLKNE